ncbi:PBSX family phage terminase large subunit [Dactylosporangium sp. NPDC000521]|uniref:PBSX family phage terminase large subunit n=1 Tax=Dactylosporangium sp. NPDC000521 TaxID=3363975 RepID=UPI003690CAC1
MTDLLTAPPPQREVLLSEKQERSIAHATARINLWTGSIRSGKTISSLLCWLIYVANAPRGGQLVVTGKTYGTVARNVFGPLMDPMVTGPAASLIKYTRGAETASILGRQIEVITANDARAEGRLRGMTCAGAYGDELSLLPEAFFDQLLGRMSVPGARFFGTSNPDNPNHWLRKRFLLRAAKLGLRHWHFTLDDNPGLDPAYVRSIKREYVGLWYKRFIEGLWVLAEGAIFDAFDDRKHVVTKLPAIRRWLSLGVDYGTAHPFAAVMLALGADGRLYLTNEWRHDSIQARRRMAPVEYSHALRSWLGTLDAGEPLAPEYVLVDSAAADFRVQLAKDGLPNKPAKKEVVEGLRTMMSLFATDRLRIHSSCVGLLSEIPGYSWDDKAALEGRDEPIKAGDDSIDAARYAIYSTRSIWWSLLRRSQLDLAA